MLGMTSRGFFVLLMGLLQACIDVQTYERPIEVNLLGDISGESVTLVLNNDEQMTLTQEGTTTFQSRLRDFSSYSVTQNLASSTMECLLRNHKGEVRGIITVEVDCLTFRAVLISQEQALATYEIGFNQIPTSNVDIVLTSNSSTISLSGTNFTILAGGTSTVPLFVSGAGSFDISGTASSSDPRYTGAFTLENALGTVFVDADAPAGGNGESWATAYRFLQDGLAEASGRGVPGVEVWVAEGIYYPDEGAGQMNNVPSSTFELYDMGIVYGGFAGTETSLSERDFVNNLTVLSGDLEGDDATNSLGIIEDTNNDGVLDNDEILGNAYHIINNSTADVTATLDGVTITGGNAINAPNDEGGVLLIQDSNVTLRNLNLIGNTAVNGGAIKTGMAATLYLENVHAQDNIAQNNNGVIAYANGPLVEIRNSRFMDNRAGGLGGVANIVSNSTTNVTVINSIFSENRAAGFGAAISVEGPSLDFIVVNSLFENNMNNGGLAGNLAAGNGAKAFILNSTVANSANTAGFIAYDAGPNPSKGFIQNSIFWMNSSSTCPSIGPPNYFGNEQVCFDATQLQPDISHSIIQGLGSLTGGTDYNDLGGNLDLDPGLNITDFTISTGSPAYNAGDAFDRIDLDQDGNSTERLSDVLDLDGDGNTTEPPPIDLAGNPRFVGTIDMGPFEVQQ